MPEPYYFSDTNARASGHGYTGGLVNGQTVYVATAVLKLNGETVRTYQWQAGEPQVSSVTLAVMFDSSHFAHDSTVTVEFIFVDSLGRWFNDDMQAPVKNRVISYSHHDEGIYPRAAAVPQIFLGPQNDSSKLQDGGGWIGSAMLEDLDGATAVQYAGHGAPGHFVDDTDEPVYAVGLDSVLEYRMEQMGGGDPPFNTGYAPPIGFALILACCCGADDRFVSFLHPGKNAYSSETEDQAVLAFSASPYLAQYSYMSAVIHENLVAGYSVFSARQYVLNDGQFSVEVGGNEVDLAAAHFPIYGDPFTRLKNVYLPMFHGRSLSWSRGI
ncbi:MAG: hypothetical protein IT207_01980 [Fimbriimonadaceae bacterium]|nr:hypothetical protein [Fimbriimonadaceae bacterium]